MGQNAPRILVIDDDPYTQVVLALAFTDEGFVVETARKSEDVIRAALRFSPDVVLLDVAAREDGRWALLLELKANERTRSIPVVVLSATPDQHFAMRALESGACSYIDKLSPTAIALVIKEAFRCRADAVSKAESPADRTR